MEFRFINENESEKCNIFHNTLYRKNRTIFQWKWGFLYNSFEPGKILYSVCSDSNEIVGTQTMIPIKMIDKNGIFWTAKSEATLVHPQYRGKQVFQKMYDLMFDYAEKNKFVYIWGFTQATKALKAIGFETPFKTSQIYFPFTSVYNINTNRSIVVKVLSPFIKIILSIARLFSTVKLISEKPKDEDFIDIVSLNEPPEEAGKVCEMFIRDFGGKTIYRDTEYLNWRLFNNPYSKSIVKGLYVNEQLTGWVAYTIGDDGLGYLVDIIAINDSELLVSVEDKIKRLLYEAIIGTRDMGATGLRGWNVTKHQFDLLLLLAAKELGFYSVHKGYFSVIYKTNLAKEDKEYSNLEDWYVTRIYTEGTLG